MLINSIYKSSEGEGVWIGTPQIFIRLQGCSVGCVNCDSKNTWDFDLQMSQTLDEILFEVEALSLKKLKRISITGGDPLHPSHVPNLILLIKELKKRDFYLNIEAAGTRIVKEVFDLVDFISYDFKTPSTQVKTSIDLLIKFVKDYESKGQIKSVVSDQRDLRASQLAMEKLNIALPMNNIPWILTPCYNPEEDFPSARFSSILRFNEEIGSPFRVIGQQHKWVYGSKERNV